MTKLTQFFLNGGDDNWELDGHLTAQECIDEVMDAHPHLRSRQDKLMLVMRHLTKEKPVEVYIVQGKAV